jgi:tetratricopeptide (TPR) repeat protein
MFEPGLKYEYSGGGITISQLILTDVTRQKYETWMYENVLKPIGMVNSSFAQPPAKDKRHLCASGYYSDGSPVANKFRVYPFQAAAGLWTTPSDLCHYIIDMQLAYQGKQSKVLSNEMVKLHLTPYNNGPAAMGTFFDDRDGAKYFLHDASNDGFCGLYVASLDGGDGVVVFLNSGDATLLLEILNSVAKAYNWKNYYREPQHRKTDKIINLPDKVLKSYEGIYLYDQSWAGIQKKQEEYHFYSAGVYAKMYFTTPTSFFNEEFQAVKTFINDEKGIVGGYTRTVNDKQYPNAIKIANPDTLTLENGAFQEIGTYLFENRKYKEAVAYYKRALQLYPGDLNLLMNMAHSYLFSNDYKSAMAIYKAHLQDTISIGNSWENQLQNDLFYFKEHRYDVTRLEKVFTDLKIKKPNDY